MINNININEIILNLIEIQAYRKLQDYKYNDFGFIYDKDEHILNLGSEDAYYRIDEHIYSQIIEDYYEGYYDKPKKSSNSKNRLNRYEKKQITKKKLKKLLNKSKYYVICNNQSYLKRCYLSKHSNGNVSKTSYYKRISNKKVRQYKSPISNGRCYSKIYDYWYEVD